jgi:hypothetical protein
MLRTSVAIVATATISAAFIAFQAIAYIPGAKGDSADILRLLAYATRESRSGNRANCGLSQPTGLRWLPATKVSFSIA